MPGLMRSWFDPTRPKIPHAHVTENITNNMGGGGGGTAGPAGVAPGTTQDEFMRNQQAYYQNMLAGLGQGQEGGGLPQGIQDNIDKQASLITS